MHRRVGIARVLLGGRSHWSMSPKGVGPSAPFDGAPLPRELAKHFDGAFIVRQLGSRIRWASSAQIWQRVSNHKAFNQRVKTFRRSGTQLRQQLPPAAMAIGVFRLQPGANHNHGLRVFSFFGEHLRGDA